LDTLGCLGLNVSAETTLSFFSPFLLTSKCHFGFKFFIWKWLNWLCFCYNFQTNSIVFYSSSLLLSSSFVLQLLISLNAKEKGILLKIWLGWQELGRRYCILSVGFYINLLQSCHLRFILSKRLWICILCNCVPIWLYHVSCLFCSWRLEAVILCLSM
jgi:hypothetical protein